MTHILLVDDSRSEAVLWRHTIGRHCGDDVRFSWSQTVEAAVTLVLQDVPDVIVLDNNVPPHRTADAALDAFKDLGFKGRIYVWSNFDSDMLAADLARHNGVEVLSKGDYVGSKLSGLIQQLAG